MKIHHIIVCGPALRDIHPPTRYYFDSIRFGSVVRFSPRHDVCQRCVAEDYSADSTKDMERKRREKKRRERTREKKRKADEEEKRQAEAEKVTLDKIDDYMELLYADDMETRVRGTSYILTLARDASNLE